MKSEITINVNANLCVDQRTAETCLKLVETYMNSTGSTLLCEKAKDGGILLFFKKYRDKNEQ